MEYSTDNSHSIASNYGAQKQAQDYHSQKERPGHLATLQANSPKQHASPSRLRQFVAENRTASTTEQDFASPKTKPSFEGAATTDDDEDQRADVKAMLSNFLDGKSISSSLPAPSNIDDAEALMRSRKSVEVAKRNSPEKVFREDEPAPPPRPPAASISVGGRPALKDDPKYERYFRMLKVGMPIEIIKHAMQKDGTDPSVLDGDHNKPVGLALRDDPKYDKYFKMLKIGISMDQIKHALERDNLMPEIMDQDHNLPANSCELRSRSEPKKKETHRRARLHWKTVQKVCRNSLWAKIEKDPGVHQIDIDEEEFNELFKADLTPSLNSPRGGLGANRTKGAAVRVIDAKRANNGGIILARVKMTHDEMADAVDRMYVVLFGRRSCRDNSNG
jgi:DNA-binding transcriptional MerR regulator